MTTGLTVSITDELAAELEQYSGVPSIDALLVERAELKRDRERYQKLRTVTPYRFKKIQDSAITDGGDVFYFHSDKFDAGLDASSDGIASEDKQ